MKAKLIASRSSLLSYPAVIAVLGVAGCLAGFFGYMLLCGVLLLLFLITLFARLWVGAAAGGIRLTLEAPMTKGVFPGQPAVFTVLLKNEKLLPLLWTELSMPLPETLCVLPESHRIPEEWEHAPLQEQGASTQQIGTVMLPALKWYGTAQQTFTLQARSRGIWNTAGWTLRTGDGLGLCQAEVSLQAFGIPTGSYAVYPELVPVQTGLFLSRFWNAETGDRGVMEDVTVIRTTRDYAWGDAVSHINWRLAARGLPLTVNVYEEILPRSAHFILDGESFSGPEKHPEALEATLSILSSLLLELEDADMRCSISLSRGKENEPVTVSRQDGAELEELLWYLAAYQPMPDLLVGDTNRIARQKPEYDLPALKQQVLACGHSWLFTYSAETLSASLLQALSEDNTALLLWDASEQIAGYDCYALQEIRSEVAI